VFGALEKNPSRSRRHTPTIAVASSFAAAPHLQMLRPSWHLELLPLYNGISTVRTVPSSASVAAACILPYVSSQNFSVHSHKMSDQQQPPSYSSQNLVGVPRLTVSTPSLVYPVRLLQTKQRNLLALSREITLDEARLQNAPPPTVPHALAP
jgi:hypothetical protein